jgi:AraC-like DNA-binding protein
MADSSTEKPVEVSSHPCAEDLAPFLHRHMHGAGADGRAGSLRIPPTGGIFLSYVPGSPLVVHFRERAYTRRPRFFVGGQLRREQPLLVSDGRFELIGTEFTPTGFYRLFRKDASVYTDDIGDFCRDFPDHAAWLEERLDDRAPLRKRLDVIEELIRRLAADAAETPRVDAAVRSIASRRGMVKVEDIAGQVGLTTRQLHRRFVRAVGVSPKHYAKIVQVNEVFGALLAGDYEHIRELALDHGYFDQAHFIRDFQRFVGMSPTRFLESGSAFLRTYLGKASRP